MLNLKRPEMTQVIAHAPADSVGWSASPNGAVVRTLGLVVLSGLAAVLLWLGAQAVVFNSLQPMSTSTNVDQQSEPLRPDAPIEIAVQGAGAELNGVQLYRRPAGGNGQEQRVATSLVPVSEGRWRLQSAGGNQTSALQPDSEYRLLVSTLAPRPSLPLPARDEVRNEVRFSTVSGPRLASGDIQAEPLRPMWGEPIELRWSMPMASATVAIQPPAPFQSWVDQDDPTRAWVRLGDDSPSRGLADGTTYELLVTSALSRDGLELTQPQSMRVAVPVRPQVVRPPDAPVTLRLGETLTLQTSVPLATADVRASDGVPIKTQIDGTSVQVRLLEFRQGRAFTVELAGATTFEGAPLAQPVRVDVRTPAPLAPPVITPEQDATEVDGRTRPAVAFGAPIADRQAVEQSLRIEPDVAGRWEWVAADRVEFVPDDGRLPPLTDFSIRLAGGPASARRADGGYLEADVVSSFRTNYYKRIVVDLSEQRMYLYQDGEMIRRIIVGTGVAGAETPIGEYEVLYKMAKTRMQGVNPNGTRYDIPDVPWVLPFWGDYAIHGNYWRSTFGTVGSNGCVGMPVDEAKFVYDWSDVGTPVIIRA